MPTWTRRAATTLILLGVALSLALGCSDPQNPAPPARTVIPQAEAGSQAGGKQLRAAILGAPRTMVASLQGSDPAFGFEALEELTNAGLANVDDQGRPRPQLAEEVPSSENGLWQVLPDGRMSTTWKIRPRATWHDGTPFTVRDLLFTLSVGRDPAFPQLKNPAYDLIERVEAPDERTFTVIWRMPYLRADQLFSRSLGPSYLPLARHRLEPAYENSKEGFFDDPYWTTQFIGTGPFWMQKWLPGQLVALEAADYYVLGAPIIDHIDVVLFPDSTSLGNAVLSGNVDLTLGSGLSYEEAQAIRDQWRTGRLYSVLSGTAELYPQFVEPDPPVLANPQFRRALYQAIDRQELADRSTPSALAADTFLVPGDEELGDVEDSIIRYPYDPQRAQQLLAGLGYAPGGDDGLRGSNGQALAVEVRSSDVQSTRPGPALIAAAWRQLGVATTTSSVPPERRTDRQWLASFRGFELSSRTTDPRNLQRFHSSQAPATANDYRGTNTSRYASPELDMLVERYQATIPWSERSGLLQRLVRHVSDQLVIMPLYYESRSYLIASHLFDVTAARAGTLGWNGERWNAP